MNRYALLEDDTVMLVVEQDSMPVIPGNWIDISSLLVGPGYRYKNNIWISPLQQVPEFVTMRQARLALHNNGLLSQVQPLIDALSEPEKTKAQIEWEYSSTVLRNNGFVSLISAGLGLTESQLDDLFIEANNL